LGAWSFHSLPSGSRTVISLVPQWVSSPSVNDLDGGIELEGVGIGHGQHDVPSSRLGLGDLGDEQGRAVTASELAGVVVCRELDFVAQP
jgi:hypothetical protein